MRKTIDTIKSDEAMEEKVFKKDMEWDELAFLTNRQMNQYEIEQDPVCQRIIQGLKHIEEFLNCFEDLAFDRNLIICRKPIFSFNAILPSLVFTAGSIISCCESGCLADANTLLRKYRDDMFFYLYIVVYNENSFDQSAKSTIKEMENNIECWDKDGLADLSINLVLKTIASFPEMKNAIIKYKLKSFFDLLNVRLNNFVHSNGISYYNRSFDTYRINKFQKDLQMVLTDMQYTTVSFLFLLTLCSPITIMSTDYVDHLELNLDPPTDSQYWVAPFVEDFFKSNLDVIDRSCIDYLRENTPMIFLNDDDSIHRLKAEAKRTVQ